MIDATIKGNESRFINHSCDPNCEVRQIRINNENKLIFFACCDIHAGDESRMITNSHMKRMRLDVCVVLRIAELE